MDEADRADVVIEQERTAVLAMHRARQERLGASATHCLECGEPIPEGRRNAIPGVEYCVTHQAEIELRGRRR